MSEQQQIQLNKFIGNMCTVLSCSKNNKESILINWINKWLGCTNNVMPILVCDKYLL
jgi:hypothetical protein